MNKYVSSPQQIEMHMNELYEKLIWMICYPFAITTKALRNHNLFSFSLQVHGKLIKPYFKYDVVQ